MSLSQAKASVEQRDNCSPLQCYEAAQKDEQKKNEPKTARIRTLHSSTMAHYLGGTLQQIKAPRAKSQTTLYETSFFCSCHVTAPNTL